ncbi:cation:proton antiporter [Streptomyces monticola]|uniref:Cation:proton antiporter n=1 Tax=Streptomyces monticola TaxID=2666263 RepID=A0ABW2JGS8_9ACTN
MTQPGTLILIMAIAVLAPLLAYRVNRWVPVPLVIFEIVLGILIGPDVLALAQHDEFTDGLADFGLAMLIFLAGYEIDFAAVRGDTLRRSTGAWMISIAAGLGIAFALTGAEVNKSFVIGTALTSTALGTVLPILRDSGDLRGRFGTVVLAFGAVGEFGPIIAMALLLSGRGAGESTVLLIVFAAVTAAAVFWALRPRPPWFARIIANTLHSSGQFAVRYVMLLLAAMLGLSHAFGIDVLLGAFAAGVISRLILHGAAPESSGEILGKIEAMGFGFFVPVFFVVTGINFDLKALLDGGRALVLLPVFLLLFLVVRGIPLYLLAPSDLSRRDRTALTLYGSTCLPLVVAITTIGLDDKSISSSEAAALVGAAMVSVLVFPLLALKFRSGRGESAADRAGHGEGSDRPSRAGEASESW